MELDNQDTFTEQITVKGNKAYIFTVYYETENGKQGEINEIDLKTMNVITRTIIENPNERFNVMVFGVL